jgi:DNA polymerase III subunit beta
LYVRATGSARTYKLTGMPAADFPPLPSPGDSDALQLPAATLAKLIEYTAHAVCADDSRANIVGALLELQPGAGKNPGIARMLATDAHRVSRAECAVEGLREKARVLIHSKAVQELKKILDETGDSAAVGLVVTRDDVFFRVGEVQLAVKPLDASRFPPLAEVIDATRDATKSTLRAPRSALADAIKAVSLAAVGDEAMIVLTVSGRCLSLVAETPLAGSSSDEVPVEYDGPELKIGFRAQYLLDELSALTGDEVMMWLGKPLDPAVISESDTSPYIGIVMPMVM